MNHAGLSSLAGVSAELAGVRAHKKYRQEIWFNP
jgi:hypothetical protein